MLEWSLQRAIHDKERSGRGGVPCIGDGPLEPRTLPSNSLDTGQAPLRLTQLSFRVQS